MQTWSFYLALALLITLGRSELAPPRVGASLPTDTTYPYPLNYHGGPVLSGNVSIYYIWYGSQWNTSAQSILIDLASHLFNHPYMLSLNLFTDSNNNPGSSTVTYGGSYYYGSSLGQSLSDNNIKNIVLNSADGTKLPKSPNAVYFVLTSPEIAVPSGFCTVYCGWHNFISSEQLVYAFVGNPATKCLDGCAAQSVSPNGDAGVDAMASVIMHELIESITDPLLNGWKNTGGENGDACAWTWGPYNVSSNGAAWNMKIGERYFLIQQTLLNGKRTATCAQSYYPCPAGYYNNLKSSQGPNSCIVCPVNTYNPTPGKAEASSCLPCPTNLTGQTSCSIQITCPPNSDVVVSQGSLVCVCWNGYLTYGTGTDMRCLSYNWEHSGVGGPLSSHYYFDRVGGQCSTGEVLSGLSFSRGGCNLASSWGEGKLTPKCTSPSDSTEGLILNTKCLTVSSNPLGTWTATGVASPLSSHYYFDRVGGKCPLGKAALGARFRRGGCGISAGWTEGIINDNLCSSPSDNKEGLYLDLLCADVPGLGTAVWRYSGVGAPLSSHFYFDRLGAECLLGEAVVGVKFARGGCSRSASWGDKVTDTNLCSSPSDSTEGLTMWLLCAPMASGVSFVDQEEVQHAKEGESGAVRMPGGLLAGGMVGCAVLVALIAFVVISMKNKRQQDSDSVYEQM